MGLYVICKDMEESHGKKWEKQTIHKESTIFQEVFQPSGEPRSKALCDFWYSLPVPLWGTSRPHMKNWGAFYLRL